MLVPLPAVPLVELLTAELQPTKKLAPLVLTGNNTQMAARSTNNAVVEAKEDISQVAGD
jgi:hypothetical protein